MKLKDIIDITKSTVITIDEDINFDRDVQYGLSCDLMSDVLMVLRKQADDIDVEENSVLITGLATMQAIRTAEVLDIDIVMFVRGKQPNETVIKQAKDNNIILLTTKHMMYRTCGELFCSGLKGIS